MTPQKKSKWRSCPPGQLSKVVRQNRAEQELLRRRKFLIQTSTLGVLAIGAIGGIGGTAMLFRNNSKNLEIKVTCVEAMEFMDQYFDGQLENHLSTKIDQHLAVCNHCKNVYDEHSNDMA